MPDGRRPVARSRRRTRRTTFPRFWSLAAVAAVLLGVVAALALRVRSMGGPLGIDVWVSEHLFAHLPSEGMPGGPDYEWIARVGAPLVVVGLTAVTMIWAWRRRDIYGGLLAAVTPGMAFVLAEEVVKPVVGRGIDDVWMFPSGTVTVVAASVVMTVVLVYRWTGRTGAILAALALAPIPLGLCATVIVLHWHYATDTVGGLALGGAVVFAVAGVLAGFEESATRSRARDATYETPLS